MIKPVPIVERIAPCKLAQSQTDLISLAQNESAYGPSASTIEAGRLVMSKANLYPDANWSELREAIAEEHELCADHLLCGAGSLELIAAIIRAYSQSGDEVLGTVSGYSYVATACQQAGSKYRQVPDASLTVSIDEILEAVTPATKIVFVCNPGNPAGTCIKNAELIRLRHSLPDMVLLVIDQAYAEFDQQEHECIFDLIEIGNTIITRTFSKAYALAGQRVGWGAFPESITTQVRKLLSPHNVSLVAQSMATAAMKDQAHMREVVTQTVLAREWFIAELRDAGFDIPQSYTNFVLVPFRSNVEAERADHQLRQAGFLVRGMAAYELEHCLRITVERQDKMRKVAAAIIKAQSIDIVL